ncbi:LysE family translocator [Sciscionella sediminilitoris]|uniref:LysE family translocator n=1 Tax=Sciscionella sediminilitoris TaxID=1445613 RepID=UPI0004DF9428|nr:LysE family translocator [Sciscionella sp. SE31]
MTWQNYGAFAALAVLVIIVPGPDFALILKHSLHGGRRAGLAASAGITTSNLIQGSAAALGLGALIVASEPVFLALRWAGIAYLAFLGVQALRSAIAGNYTAPAAETGTTARVWTAYRQGFLSNITNPKVLTLYLSVLPQFLGNGTTGFDALLLAYSHAVLGLVWLLLVVTALRWMRGWLTRARVRRWLDAVTGCVLIGFGVRLATE